MSAHPELIDAGGVIQRTPLSEACYMGHVEAVRVLLEHGARTDLQDSLGQTALFLASRRGFEAVVCLLLEKGASASLMNNGGVHALSAAASTGRVGVVRALLRHGAQALVNCRNERGEGALWWACRHGQVEVVLALLVEGAADWTLTDRLGRTPADVALHWGHNSCVYAIQVSWMAWMTMGSDIGGNRCRQGWCCASRLPFSSLCMSQAVAIRLILLPIFFVCAVV